MGDKGQKQSTGQMGNSAKQLSQYKKCTIQSGPTIVAVLIIVCLDTCMFIQATSSTYKATDMCDSPAKDYGWIDPGMIHRVTMDK